MADETTTTTTESTTTTTTQPQTTTTTTVEKQGEVRVNKSAEANVLGGDNSGAKEDAKATAENIENAKQQALANHAAHVSSQPTN